MLRAKLHAPAINRNIIRREKLLEKLEHAKDGKLTLVTAPAGYGKTTAVRLIPVPGKEAGEFVSFGGLFGESAITPVRNVGKSARFVQFAGKIPAPIHSLRN